MPEPPADALSRLPSRDFVESQLEFTQYESSLPVPAVQSKAVPGRPVGRISQLRYKRARGEVLTEAEQAELAAYYARYTRRKKGVHLKGSREEQWTRLAERQGVPLSAWIQERVEETLQGPGAALQELRDENQRLRDEVAGLRGASGQLAVDNSRLQSRIEAMEGSLMEAMDQALRLAEASA